MPPHFDAVLLTPKRSFSKYSQEGTRTTMAADGLKSTQCQKHAAFQTTFRNHFDASMVIFILNVFIIQLSVRLLIALDNAPKNMSKFSRARSTILAKLLGSTILLGIAACLFIFQILFVIFLGYCLDDPLSKTSLILTCIVAAIDGIFVSAGVVAWLGTTAVFIFSSSSWFSNIKSETEKQSRGSATADVEDTLPAGELARRDEQALCPANIQYPPPTLPPYTA